MVKPLGIWLGFGFVAVFVTFVNLAGCSVKCTSVPSEKPPKKEHRLEEIDSIYPGRVEVFIFRDSVSGEEFFVCRRDSEIRMMRLRREGTAE